MKFNPLLFLIFVILAGTLAWAGYEMCDTARQSLAMAAVVGIGMTIGGVFVTLDMGHANGNANGRAAAVAYMALHIVINTVFSFTDFSIPALVITNLLLLVLLLLAIYMIGKVRNV